MAAIVYCPTGKKCLLERSTCFLLSILIRAYAPAVTLISSSLCPLQLWTGSLSLQENQREIKIELREDGWWELKTEELVGLEVLYELFFSPPTQHN